MKHLAIFAATMLAAATIGAQAGPTGGRVIVNVAKISYTAAKGERRIVESNPALAHVTPKPGV